MSDEKVGPTPGPWEYVPSDDNHGPYVVAQWGGDVCDCYTMSNLSDWAVCNGGTSKPVHFQHEHADANARLIASAPTMAAVLREVEVIMSVVEPRSDKNEYLACLGHVRVAIAKAEGSTQ
jgi:hypothetical protein